MAARKKITCPECEQPSSIDLKQCGNPKDNGGLCTFSTHEHWESFTPKTHLFAATFFLACSYFLEFQSTIPNIKIASESVPFLHYLTMAIRYSPFAVLFIGLFFLVKAIIHFSKRPALVNP
jgi:hypothetical protein